MVSQLHELGWRPQAVEGGFAAGQPQFNFQIPLVDAEGAPRSEADVLSGMNQLWRRNIKKADKAGVDVTFENGEGMQHVYQFLAGRAVEGDEAVERIGTWLASRLGT